MKKQQYSKIPFFVKRKEICTFYAKWSIKETLQSAAKIIYPMYNKDFRASWLGQVRRLTAATARECVRAGAAGSK